MRFRIRLPIAGGPEVELDGQPVQGLRSVAAKSELGEVTKLYLEFVGDATLEGEGIVHVVRDLDQRQAVVEWLANLDAGELEREVLERMGWGSGTTGEVTLAVLREWVSGAGA